MPFKPANLTQYEEHLADQGYSPATIARKKASVGKFQQWADSRETITIPAENEHPRKRRAWIHGVLLALGGIGLLTMIVIVLLNQQSRVAPAITSRAVVVEPTPGTRPTPTATPTPEVSTV